MFATLYNDGGRGEGNSPAEPILGLEFPRNFASFLGPPGLQNSKSG